MMVTGERAGFCLFGLFLFLFCFIVFSQSPTLSDDLANVTLSTSGLLGAALSGLSLL